MDSENSYQINADTTVRNVLLEYECQPILFVGSGIPRRYFGAPNWIELLKSIYGYLPSTGTTFEYFIQKFSSDPIAIGEHLSHLIFEWAWGTGKNTFPPDMFKDNPHKDSFIKYLACNIISNATPKISDISDKKNLGTN